MASITFTIGNWAGETFELDQEKYLLGRSATSDIQLADPSVSRNHATLVRNPNGSYTIEDNGSSFGTFVNGNRVKKANLTHGAKVRMGAVEFDFYFEAQNEKQAQRPVREPVPSRMPLDDERPTGQFEIHQRMTLFEAGQEKKESVDQLKAANERLRIATEVSEAIYSNFDLETLYHDILKEVFPAIRAKRASILTIDEKTGKIISKASLDSSGKEQAVPYSTTIVRNVIDTGESLLFENAQKDLDQDAAMSVFQHDILSAICVPIRTREKIIGALIADASGASVFTENDLRLLTLIGNQAGMVIHNAQLFEENIKSERLAAVGQTVASLAHCIKNILQGLSGGSYMVDEGLKTEDYNMVTMAWPMIKESQTNITQLVMNMLDYSKERKPAYEKANLKGRMENICKLMVERAKDKNVSVQLRYDDATPDVECDSMAIYRATLNLVTNAIDAVEENEGRVLIDVGLDKNQECIRIAVKDNGSGIPDDVLGNLFEAFKSTKDSKGTGLGLAVSKKIAVEHGGDIVVKTKLGKGTIFSIVFPIKHSPSDGQ